ncbi:sulfite exporter TauE/SafE family protein [uncultured Winogradskyella sp.]|uniref:sulfite exporter TauE/SafE family protein n=1 Tax=uncultured Winogradskyella sp. TaxID=395353 RepID=UPI00261B03F0|nr:sulfite exporter TauE/SafE family protein [uncultured Winogradskyella sp.]
MLTTAFILGLLGSLHCVGMCGPIAFMLPVDRSNSFKKITQIVIYHFGRLLAYSIIGLVFGIVGKSLYIFGFQQQLSIGIGILMIALVLIPYKTIGKYNLSKPLNKLLSKLRSNLAQALKKKTADTFLSIGFLNGFLPCGLVYMAIFGAIATGSLLQGSFYMVLFGLGTIPLMTSAIYIGKFLNYTIKQKIQKAIPVLVIIIGALFIARGLGLDIPYISPAPIIEPVLGNINCH